MGTAKQARGYTSKLRIGFEKDFRQLPDDPTCYLMPFVTEGLDGGRASNSKSTVSGRRSPSRPNAGNMSVSGPLSLPSNIHASGIILKMCCGSPVTTSVNDVLNLSGSAENLGAGYVKLLCNGHGLRPFTQITISGSVNYDGIYLIDPKSGANDLVIEAVYAAEDFAGTETVRRGAHRKLDAAPAVDKGNGLVGLPCAQHGYLAGSSITVIGSTGYDADYVVDFSSSVNEIVVKAIYAAEVFAGTETVSPKYFKHLFKLLDEQPSFVAELEIPLTGDEDNESFMFFEGAKVNSFSCSSSGDSQLTFSLDIVGANKRLLAESAFTSSQEFPDHDFENFDGDLMLDGEYMASVTSTAINVGMNLDSTDGYVKGSKGTLMSLSEGEPSLSGSLTVHYKDTKLVKKATEQIEMAYSMGFVSGPNQLALNYPQCLLQDNGSTPKINGPQGVVAEYQVSGFEDHNDFGTCFYAELINGVSSYA